MLHVDTLLVGGHVFNSAYRRFRDDTVALVDGRILYVGSDPEALGQIEADHTQDLGGGWLIPGLVDAHMHIESSMVTPPVFLRAALRHGTTTCIAEPHEIANVFGVEGIHEFIRLANEVGADGADVYFGAPSSVPSTDLEDAGAAVTPEDVGRLMHDPRVRCLGEVMDCRTLIHDPGSRIAQVVRAAQAGKEVPVIEGHVPSFQGLDLARILFAGVDSDHCGQTPDTLRDRFDMGMFVEVQLKSCSPEVIGWLAQRPQLAGLWSFVTDDVMADQLRDDHLARVVRRGIELGLPAEEAVYAATTSPAMRMDLRDRGRIAPGRNADLVLLDDLQGFHVSRVWRAGKEVDRGVGAAGEQPGQRGISTARHDFPEDYYHSVHLDHRGAQDFRVAAPRDAGDCVSVRTMRIQKVATATPEDVRRVPVRDGEVRWQDVRGEDGRALCLARVFERHHGLHRAGTGILSGLCLQRGAVASTWVHDHHNLLVVGRDADEMALAANAVIEMQGGMAVVEDGKVVARMPLPVAGILTEVPLGQAADDLHEVTEALRRLGWGNVNPVMSLCTIALPVSPALKVTDRGLVDVRAGKLVDLFVPDGEDAQ